MSRLRGLLPALLIVALTACSSASSAGPKTTSPSLEPVAPAPTASAAAPATMAPAITPAPTLVSTPTLDLEGLSVADDAVLVAAKGAKVSYPDKPLFVNERLDAFARLTVSYATPDGVPLSRKTAELGRIVFVPPGYQASDYFNSTKSGSGIVVTIEDVAWLATGDDRAFKRLGNHTCKLKQDAPTSCKGHKNSHAYDLQLKPYLALVTIGKDGTHRIHDLIAAGEGTTFKSGTSTTVKIAAGAGAVARDWRASKSNRGWTLELLPSSDQPGLTELP